MTGEQRLMASLKLIEEELPSPNIFIPDSWLQASDFIATFTDPPPITVICGPKNAGKSTFSRFLVNTLFDSYRKVAYLDTDVGQPEFTAPGCLSLHIIDTKTPGAGYEILVDMLRYIAPTHVVNIHISVASKNLPTGTFWLDGGQVVQVSLINLTAARQDSMNRSVLVQKHGRLMRDLRIIAYFRQCFPSDLNITTYKELAYAFASHPPYEVPISRMKVTHLHCQVPLSEIFFSLNGTIVGLAVNSGEPTESNTFKPRCIGLGIVRGVDIFKDIFYVITPVPQCDLERVDLFLQGLIEIPTSLLQVRGCISPYMSSNVLPTS